MKYKTTTLLLIILLLSTTLQSIAATQPQEPLDDPIPSWTVGESWTYTIYDFSTALNVEGQLMAFDGRIDDMVMTVSSIGSSTKTVDFTGTLDGDFTGHIGTTVGNLLIQADVYPRLSKMSGTIIYNNELQVKHVDAEVVGITLLYTDKLPIPIPYPYRATLTQDYSTSFPLLDFPLYGWKFWSLPDNTITTQIRLGDYFGLATYVLTITQEIPYIPLPFAFFCDSKDTVLVDAGSYDAYHVSLPLFQGLSYHYAPSVGNIIKYNIETENTDFRGELKSYSG